MTSPVHSLPPTRRVVQDVVLVEDNSMDRRLIHHRFHQNFAPTRWREFEMGRTALDACLMDPPDLLLLDLHLPDLHGLEVLHVLRQDSHQFPVIVMTSSPEVVSPKLLIDLNVHGYFDKHTLKSGLPAAVNSVLDGRIFFSASRSPAQPTIKPLTLPLLSEREKEIARLVTHGFPSKHIANRLNLSVRTVENHRARIMTRLGLVNTADLVRWCVRHGVG